MQCILYEIKKLNENNVFVIVRHVYKNNSDVWSHVTSAILKNCKLKLGKREI